MAEYTVYIEIKGDPITPKGPIAHVPTLPGASAQGQTIEEAKEKIRESVRSYLALLSEAGEAVPEEDEPIQLEFEEIDNATLPTDYNALHPNELENLLRWMAISRQDLMSLVNDLPAETLDWKASQETPSIGEILYQIAEADLWYTDRLKKWPEAPLFRLAAARSVALERLRNLTEKEWSGITIYNKQRWTLRKILRRMLEYEREQIHQIRVILSRKQGG